MFNQSILSEATTGIDTPDPDLSKFKVCGWQIAVRPLHLEGKTKGGIILTDSLKDDAQCLINVCKVLKMGPQCYTQEGFQGEKWCKEGDYVLIPKLTGQKISYQGYPITLVTCDRVLAVLDDPYDIDPNFNLTGLTKKA
jgi:co-chaperonin GroES (HSP10)